MTHAHDHTHDHTRTHLMSWIGLLRFGRPDECSLTNADTVTLRAWQPFDLLYGVGDVRRLGFRFTCTTRTRTRTHDASTHTEYRKVHNDGCVSPANGADDSGFAR